MSSSIDKKWAKIFLAFDLKWLLLSNTAELLARARKGMEKIMNHLHVYNREIIIAKKTIASQLTPSDKREVSQKFKFVLPRTICNMHRPNPNN